MKGLEEGGSLGKKTVTKIYPANKLPELIGMDGNLQTASTQEMQLMFVE